MSKRFFFGLSIMAMVFALILGSGALNTATAVPGENGDAHNLPAGVSNLFGKDNGRTPVKVIYKDCDPATNQFAPDDYGLFGTSQQ